LTSSDHPAKGKRSAKEQRDAARAEKDAAKAEAKAEKEF
jgi:hypothetical protein